MVYERISKNRIPLFNKTLDTIEKARTAIDRSLMQDGVDGAIQNLGFSNAKAIKHVRLPGSELPFSNCGDRGIKPRGTFVGENH
ncbi:hypothetical protein GXN76_14625 [Kroppenstedtia pulmonis]|uniref:Uncharacterized protein n=1 Tax=Kroppenstedtia pulmonis TaxID=1380685 RepID=A0A7D4CX22_9BACL|nr:hypothetical protein [Kroppenstedtia pulmonis]QKG85557.1 hypothetical protein GXN76_14625 [Kroppenstedtia pulmonis]